MNVEIPNVFFFHPHSNQTFHGCSTSMSNLFMIMCFHKRHKMDDVVNNVDNFLELSIYFVDREWEIYVVPLFYSCMQSMCVVSTVWQNIHFNWFFVWFDSLDHHWCTKYIFRIIYRCINASATATILGLQLWLWLSWFVKSLTFTRIDAESVDKSMYCICRCCCIYFSGHLIHANTHTYNMCCTDISQSACEFPISNLHFAFRYS